MPFGERTQEELLTALRGNPLEEILCYSLVWPLERLDEHDAVIWLRLLRIDALYT
jgi:hypothetical protein